MNLQADLGLTRMMLLSQQPSVHAATLYLLRKAAPRLKGNVEPTVIRLVRMASRPCVCFMMSVTAWAGIRLQSVRLTHVDCTNPRNLLQVSFTYKLTHLVRCLYQDEAMVSLLSVVSCKVAAGCHCCSPYDGCCALCMCLFVEYVDTCCLAAPQLIWIHSIALCAADNTEL